MSSETWEHKTIAGLIGVVDTLLDQLLVVKIGAGGSRPPESGAGAQPDPKGLLQSIQAIRDRLDAIAAEGPDEDSAEAAVRGTGGRPVVTVECYLETYVQTDGEEYVRLCQKGTGRKVTLSTTDTGAEAVSDDFQMFLDAAAELPGMYDVADYQSTLLVTAETCVDHGAKIHLFMNDAFSYRLK